MLHLRELVAMSELRLCRPELVTLNRRTSRLSDGRGRPALVRRSAQVLPRRE